ncbi:divalent-cation tolerance protein CutA [Rhodomicrobium vannielii ATCC 17100]|uniref:divalent-cation tolerance protein CutA n=1 Tax=Rhodomicrobium vannielii TaxID=1069 RepID=UPI001918877F|nr:divalent-cation tolerance protein CutA [Rhodomicrobium vannielii]MBJ7534169.1 divalent-cation tolerance protein CutA [Rhodomicrobium vannielii ATCC 17100]
MTEDAAMIVIYTTLPSEEDAQKLGSALVEEKLAACVNILPGMVSIYRWQGAVENGNEAVMLVKTRRSLKVQAMREISARHPYTVPAILVFEPSDVAASYLEWLCNQTATSR